MDDKTLLLTHMEDIARKAKKTGMAHSKFLTPSEVAQVEAAYQTRKDVELVLEGGFEEAERRVAIFMEPNWGTCERELVLTALQFKHRGQDIIQHKDVLGAVLGLGLSRDVLGDIYIEPGRATAVCLAAMADFIKSELSKIGRVGVVVGCIPIAELPSNTKGLTEKQLTIASLRLDALVAEAFNWSRADAGGAITSGKVQLAHRECLSISQPVKVDDIVSVRGKGRIKLVAALGKNRKGRLRITVGYY